MEGELIKSFLVGLGFGVDDASLAKFNKAIQSATVRVAALYTSIQTAAAGIFFSISKMSSGFEEIGYQLRLVAPAINKFLILRQAMISAYAAAGINLTRAVQQSILFNYSLAKTKFALEAVYKSVGIKFLPLLTKQMDIFRAKIFANMPKIQEQLTRFVTFIFKAFAATSELGSRLWSILSRVWEFFIRLDEATAGWSTKVIALIALWKLLNLSFLATPLGLLLTGLLSILALYDDFKVWQEGGKSFFNWSKAVPIINAVSDAISLLASNAWNALKSLIGVWRSLVDVVLDLVLAVKQLWHGDVAGFFDSLKDSGKSLLAIFTGLWDVIRSIGSGVDGFAKTIGDKIDFGSLFSGIGTGISNTIGAVGALPAISSLNQPAAPSPYSLFGGNQHVSQETHILVQGSADPNAVGKSVANEQNQVNAGVVRNLRGALR